ncbi:MAG TPA: hypothetical protein VLE91_03705 [Candidatus Saccharimonadales bacterium]|nr:hypothetical protein [Candidatus Saccharimonadales bacterium]
MQVLGYAMIALAAVFLLFFVVGIPLFIANGFKHFRNRKFFLCFLVFSLLFTFNMLIVGSVLSLHCREMKKEIHNEKDYNFFNYSFLLFPKCGNIGWLVYGEKPAGHFVIKNRVFSGLEGSSLEGKLVPYYLIPYTFFLSLIPSYAGASLILGLFFRDKKRS